VVFVAKWCTSGTLALVIVLTICLGAGAATSTVGPKGAEFQIFSSPTDANDFQMGTLDGKVVNLSSYRGKVVLLNFWRKNCPYCDMEKTHLTSMMRSLQNSDLAVLCVNLWDDPSWVRSKTHYANGPFTIATRVGNRQAVMENTVRGKLLGYFVLNGSNEAIYEVKGFPSTYVINKEGKVVATHMGLVPWNTPSVTKWVTGLLGERSHREFRETAPELPEWLDRILGGFQERAFHGSATFAFQPK
jgi:peroxiredoxin